MSWVRLPLFFGTLKIKPRRHLRRDEISRKIRVMKIGSVYVTWRPHPGGEKRNGAGVGRVNRVR